MVWGLEMLLKLFDADLITVSYAEKIARKIHKLNPEINNKVFESFLDKLDSKQ